MHFPTVHCQLINVFVQGIKSPVGAKMQFYRMNTQCRRQMHKSRGVPGGKHIIPQGKHTIPRTNAQVLGESLRAKTQCYRTNTQFPENRRTMPRTNAQVLGESLWAKTQFYR